MQRCLFVFEDYLRKRKRPFDVHKDRFEEPAIYQYLLSTYYTATFITENAFAAQFSFCFITVATLC